MKAEYMPLVSVVVPSYQQGQYIEDTLLSIMNQDYPEIEVIVVDGASTDGTRAVLERHSDRITFVSEPDNGQSNAINKGFRMAKGEIVCWLNSDDIYPDRRAVSQIVKAFQGNPGVDLIYGDFIEIDSTNRVLKIHKRPAFSYRRLLRTCYISQPATFFRRRVIESMQINEDLEYAMDLEYWLRAYNLRFRFLHLDFVVAAERVHESAKCVRSTSSMMTESRLVSSGFGLKVNRLYPLYRFFDLLLLYMFRLPGVFTLCSYSQHPHHLAIPLDFKGSVPRTLLFRLGRR